MQISELVCEIPHSENQLSLLLEAIIVSCSYPLNYCLHKDYKEGLFLWENLDQGIITQFHFLTFSVVSERISWYERTQPRYVLPLRQPLFIYERLTSPAMHLGVLFASHLAQAARARLPCTAFGEAENRYVYCIQKQTRKKNMLDSYQGTVLETCKCSHVFFPQKSIWNSQSLYRGMFSDPIACPSISTVHCLQ